MVVRGLKLAGGARSLQSLVTIKTETSLMLRHLVKDFISASRVVSQTVLRADVPECLARDSICKTGDRKMRSAEMPGICRGYIGKRIAYLGAQAGGKCGDLFISSTVCALCPAGQKSLLWGLRKASMAELFA